MLSIRKLAAGRQRREKRGVMFNSRHFICEQVAEGVYALISRELGGAMSNAGIIDMGEYSLVFDTFNSPQAGADLRAAALSLLNKPIRYVINSHWHGDHVKGNQSFQQETRISTRFTREKTAEALPGWLSFMRGLMPNLESDISKANAAMLAETDEALKQKHSAEKIYLEEIKESIETLEPTPPNLTFEGGLTLYGTKRTVELRPMGAAHTMCDTILLLPDDKLAFTGDIIVVHNHPLLADGDAFAWLKVLDQMDAMNLDKLIPGHGPVAGPEAIRTVTHYIEDILELSRQNKHLTSPEEIQRIKIPAKYQDWGASSVFYKNLESLLL